MGSLMQVTTYRLPTQLPHPEEPKTAGAISCLIKWASNHILKLKPKGMG